MYRRQLNLVVRLMELHFPGTISILRNHDIAEILGNIARENTAYRAAARVGLYNTRRERLPVRYTHVIGFFIVLALVYRDS